MALSTPLQFQTCLLLSEFKEPVMEGYLFQVLPTAMHALIGADWDYHVQSIIYQSCLQYQMQMVTMSGAGGRHPQGENVQECVKLSQLPWVV